MRYEIQHGEAFPVVKCDLQYGESLKAESDAMIAMSNTLEVNGSLNGGILGGLARKFLTGESFFFQTVNAVRGSGFVLLGHAAPGGIVDVELDGSYGLRVQKNGFLASTEGVDIDTAVQNLTQSLFSREGLFVLSIRGKGTVFLSSFGAIHAINLQAGEEVIIDNGHLVAWPDYMRYKIENRRPRRPKNANSGHFWTKEGRSTRPGSHSSRPKRTGFAAHDQIIADRPQKGKGASCANGALKRAGFNS